MQLMKYKDFNPYTAIEFLTGKINFMSEAEVRQFYLDLANYIEQKENPVKTYWKRKFFEFMCNECFYPVTEKEAAEYNYCPNCGLEIEK